MLESSYVKTTNDLCDSSHQDYYIVFNVSGQHCISEPTVITPKNISESFNKVFR